MKLILIKHAPPEVDPTISSEQWHLGEKGLGRCQPLAEKLRVYQPTVLVSSDEPKAVETAQEVGRILQLECRTNPGLHEHDRSNVPHMRSGEFISMIELFFRRPGEDVLGRETADEAYERVAGAIDSIVKANAEQTPAVVTHGTVMALFLSRHNPDRTAFELWRQLGLPSFAVLSVPEYRIETIGDRIE
jgi:broad specificity phosphatase PhoE